MKLISRRARRALALAALPFVCVAASYAADDAQAPSGGSGMKIDTGFPGSGAAAAPAAQASPTPPVDPAKPVAKVNGETIQQKDVDAYIQDYMGMMMQRMQQMGRQPDPQQLQAQQQQIAKNASVDVVRQKLVEQALKPYTAKVKDADVDKTLDQLNAFMKTQGHSLQEMVEHSGKSMSDLKDQIRKQLALNNLMEDKAGVKAPTDDEVKKTYDQLKAGGRLTLPERVHADHILVGFDGSPRDPDHKPPTDKEKAEKKSKAEEVLAKLKSGGDFTKLAAQYSTDPTNKDKGGDLGYFTRGRMTKSFEDAAFSTKPGELSPVVETEFGYHIIKVVDHSETHSLTMDELHSQLEEELMQQKTREKMPVLMAKLQKEGKIEMLDGSKLPDADEALKKAEAAPAGGPGGAPGGQE